MNDLWRSVGAVGLAEYAERFQHLAIRAMFATFAPGDYAVAFLFFGLATFAQGQSSIPIGGSKALADGMAERYLAMGGKVETGYEVTKVAIEGCSLLAGCRSRSSPARTPSSDSARN